MRLPGIDRDPAEGSIVAVRDAAARFYRRASAQNDRADAARMALAGLSPVSSRAVDALRPRIVAFGDRLRTVARAAEEAGRVLDDYAEALADLKERSDLKRQRVESDWMAIWVRRAEALDAAAEGIAEWALDWDDVMPAWLFPDAGAHLARWQDAIDRFRLSRAMYNALVDEREELDRDTAERLGRIPLVAEMGIGAGAGRGGVATAAARWAGGMSAVTAGQLAGLGDSVLVRQVWDSLSESEQQEMIARDPAVIGNLDGVPLADRAEANRISIRLEISARLAEIDRLEQRRQEALGSVFYGKDAVERTYSERIEEQQSLVRCYTDLLTQKVSWMDESGAGHVDTGARVVVFDPSRRAIATYHGALDPETGDVADWVRSVAISLPGTDTTVMDFDDDHAADLYHAAGPSSAVFQWAGGEFPQSFLGSIDPSFAQDLAPRLRDFAGGIPLPADAKLTVLGHSYGAAAIGLAEQAGLQADRILYVSPAGLGAGISGIADFPHTSQVPHYAMMTRNDLVVGPVQGQLGDFNAFHGQSALTATGVTRLETGTLIAADPFSTALEDYDVPGNASPSAIDSHASVFIPGSTAFENMVAVITGGDAQLFAEDRVIQASGRSPSMGGVDLAGFRPIYTSVE